MTRPAHCMNMALTADVQSGAVSVRTLCEPDARLIHPDHNHTCARRSLYGILPLITHVKTIYTPCIASHVYTPCIASYCLRATCAWQPRRGTSRDPLGCPCGIVWSTIWHSRSLSVASSCRQHSSRHGHRFPTSQNLQLWCICLSPCATLAHPAVEPGSLPPTPH